MAASFLFLVLFVWPEFLENRRGFLFEESDCACRKLFNHLDDGPEEVLFLQFDISSIQKLLNF